MSTRQRNVLCGVAIALLSLTRRLPAADDQQPADHSAFNGPWTLNRDLSGTPSGSSGDEAPSDRPQGGGGGGGFGGGRRGRFGGGGFGGRRGGNAEGAPDQEAVRRMREVMQEIANPTPHLVVTVGDRSITFVDAEGRSQRFTADGKKEKHQVQAGTIETKTKWEGADLRQDIDPGGSRKIVRTFSVSPENHQLVVTSTVEGGQRSRPPRRVVYYDAEPR
jgi:hypothetical protein